MQKAEKQTFDLDATSDEKQAAEKMQHGLALLEAALYVAGRPLDLNELCSVLKTRSKNKIKKLAKKLLHDYACKYCS